MTLLIKENLKKLSSLIAAEEKEPCPLTNKVIISIAVESFKVYIHNMIMVTTKFFVIQMELLILDAQP
jgi:hypothetical protein